MTHPLNILIVEKTGILKMLAIKDFKLEELYKKCGFKKSENFKKQVEWNIKYEGKKYVIHVFAKKEGKANFENKYEFPPPIDKQLFFGNCAIVLQIKNTDGTLNYINLSVDIWNKIYEKLYGGFEDLNLTAKEDEEEEDELKNIPKEKKTKHGYLKDGFVVDSDNEGNSMYEDDDYTDESDNQTNNDLEILDINELTEEPYDYK